MYRLLFLNCGKSISLINSLKKCFFSGRSVSGAEAPQMMSAIKKLGIKDYIEAAVLNPNVSRYKSQIKQLLDSSCEVGLHGGRNHALWGGTNEWNLNSVQEELYWSLNQLYQISKKYMPKGFASPEWNSPHFLPGVLKEMGFVYYGDLRCVEQEPIRLGGELPLIGVNLLGEPGGVAFFEYCRVNGLTDNEIVYAVMKSFEKLDTVILYDHPYYAGLNETDCICRIIESATNAGVKICKLEELL